MNPAPSAPLELDYPNLRPLLANCFGGAQEFPSLPWYTGNPFLDFLHLVVEVYQTVDLGVGSYQLKNKLDPKYRTESIMYTGSVADKADSALFELPTLWAKQEDIKEAVDLTRQVFLPSEDVESADRRPGYVRVTVQLPLLLTPAEKAVFLGLSLKSYERTLNSAFAINDIREDNLFGQAMKSFLSLIAQNHTQAYY